MERGQVIIFGIGRWVAMGHPTKLKNRKAQNLIEYAIVVALVSTAIVAMSTYVFRSVQAAQKTITEEFANE